MADSLGPGESALDIAELCRQHDWSRARLVNELRAAGKQAGEALPADDSLLRMVRMWVNGSRAPGPMYDRLLRRAFRLPDLTAVEPSDMLRDRLDASSCIDPELVAMLEGHTESLRRIDRRLGASRLVSQSEAHAGSIEDLVAFAPLGPTRKGLAAAGAEAAALAGWQALDQGRPKHSWQLHQRARCLALEAGDPAIIAHASAQQAYAHIDVGRPADALAQMQAVLADARKAVAGHVLAWLMAAAAEAAAACGDEATTARLLDAAAAELERGAGAHPVPYVFLDHSHLSRWRGHCLAQVGASGAVPELEAALTGMDPTFVRARASLHADLAAAHRAAGEREAANEHACEAERLGLATQSARQRRRVQLLLDAERE